MRTRLFWKFFAGLFLFSLLLAMAFYFLAVGQARDLYLRAKEDSLVRLGNLVGAELAADWRQLDPAAQAAAGAGSLQALIVEKGARSRVRLTVIDPRGRVLADSQRDPAAMQNHADRPEIAAALSGQPRSETHFSFTLRERMIYHALPLKSNGTTVAALRLSLFVSDIELVLAPWRGKVTLLLLTLLAVSLLLSLLLSGNLTRPIKELAAAFRAVSSGNLDLRVPTRRRDEIGQLTGDFNAMVDDQKRLLQQLRYGRQELEIILASLADGLLVIDAEERITRAGPSFCRLAGDSAPVGKPFWEVLRRADFAELVRQAAGAGVQAELELAGRPYFVSLAPLPDRGGTVVTFHDLSAVRSLEKQKKDLVASVSHELRTPLTAIKGYVETLAEDATGDARRFLDVIGRNTDRLIEMTDDLLALSELEEKSERLEREEIDWPGLLAGVRSLFEKRIKEKGLTLDVSLTQPAERIAFRGDRFRLEQMLINLLDNAVKYTDQGGIAVSVAADNGGLIIEVRDSGAGIPVEHLDRIFERFYVVDKARSRQNGGTGLGLAIVKHIVQLHGGEIAVQSRPGAGSTFIVRLFPA